ncbi:MAG TPA: hypothetical protein VIU61_24465 [Kofleriaceae bacterium]
MATASQLVLRARATGDASVLDAAAPLARDAVDWHAIAESDPGSDRATTALERALALAGTDVRVYRSIARIQRTLRADPAAAARTLAAGAAALLAADPPTTDWCLLADGWQRLGEHDAALDYLRHASASARTSADCCAVGELDRAEALATTVHDRIAIAKACDDAQDLDRLTANLAAAIDAIASVDDAVATMRALERFDADDDARTRCYAACAGHAKSASELIALSRIAPTDEESQRCLDEPIASPRERQRIAMLSRRPAGEWDDSKIPHLTPTELVPWSARSLGWPHEPAHLFDLLRARVDADTIREIASSDYGMDLVEHTAALEQIVAGRVPHPLAWYPLEVLQLTRWAEGDAIDHVARAFCACVLSLDEAGPTSMHDGNESTIPVLLHSCLVLGTEMTDALIGFYAAVAGSCRDPVVGAFAELAMVLAAAWRDADDPRIAEVVRRLINEEPALRKQAVLVESGWLLGCTNFDQRHALFRVLAQSVLAPVVGHDAPLTQLASLVAGG